MHAGGQNTHGRHSATINLREFFGSVGCGRAQPKIKTVLDHSACCDVLLWDYPDYFHWHVVAIDRHADWGRLTSILCPALWKFPEVDCDKDSEIVKTILGSMLMLQRLRPALFRNIPYTIRERGENDKRRLETMLQTKFPEPRTIELLEHNLVNWLGDPAQFWGHPSLPHIGQLPPAARIAGCYLRAKCLDA
jgi:hypothetical protein